MPALAHSIAVAAPMPLEAPAMQIDFPVRSTLGMRRAYAGVRPVAADAADCAERCNLTHAGRLFSRPRVERRRPARGR